MYCPNCATQNTEDTKFCRLCGANLGLVSQALSGQLPEMQPRRRERRNRHGRYREDPKISNGINKTFVGIGFLVAAFGAMLFAPAGKIWWFWLLIPAFATIGKGIAEIVAAKFEQGQLPESPPNPTPVPPAHRPAVAPRRDTGELLPSPPSVTEHTTRQLDPRRSKEMQ